MDCVVIDGGYNDGKV